MKKVGIARGPDRVPEAVHFRPFPLRPAAGRPIVILSVTLALAAVAAGCGSGPDGGGPVAAAPAAEGSGQAAGLLPELTVTDVGAGTEVALTSLVPADRPVLLWFWAPH